MFLRLLVTRFGSSLDCIYRYIFCGEPESKGNTDLPSNIFDTFSPLLKNSCRSFFLSFNRKPTLHLHFNITMGNVRTKFTKPEVSIVTIDFNLDDSKIDVIINCNISRVFISLRTVNNKLYSNLTGSANEAIGKVKSTVVKFFKQRCTRIIPEMIISAIALKKTTPTLDALAEWVISRGTIAMGKKSDLKLNLLT
jgi:hypothetical protein